MSGIVDVWVYANNIIQSARQLVNDGLRPLGLTSAEGNILLHLLTRQPAALRQEDIVAELEISKPAVSRALASLEEKNYVQRTKDIEDKRVSMVRLTAKGQQAGPAVRKVYNQVFAIAAQGVDPAAIEEAVSFFKLISENYSRARGDKKRGKGDAP